MFSCAAVAQKALKALITRLAGDATPTHEIDRLLTTATRLGVEIPTDVRGEARSLEKYYVATRYPDALGFADAALAYQLRDADTAIASATTVATWCDAEIAAAKLRDPDPP